MNHFCRPLLYKEGHEQSSEYLDFADVNINKMDGWYHKKYFAHDGMYQPMDCEMEVDCSYPR